MIGDAFLVSLVVGNMLAHERAESESLRAEREREKNEAIWARAMSSYMGGAYQYHGTDSDGWYPAKDCDGCGAPLPRVNAAMQYQPNRCCEYCRRAI